MTLIAFLWLKISISYNTFATETLFGSEISDKPQKF